jgi:hypothetical protein
MSQHTTPFSDRRLRNWWFRNGGSRDLGFHDVSQVGESPFDAADMDTFLSRTGFDVWLPVKVEKSRRGEIAVPDHRGMGGGTYPLLGRPQQRQAGAGVAAFYEIASGVKLSGECVAISDRWVRGDPDSVHLLVEELDVLTNFLEMLPCSSRPTRKSDVLPCEPRDQIITDAPPTFPAHGEPIRNKYRPCCSGLIWIIERAREQLDCVLRVR